MSLWRTSRSTTSKRSSCRRRSSTTTRNCMPSRASSRTSPLPSANPATLPTKSQQSVGLHPTTGSTSTSSTSNHSSITTRTAAAKNRTDTTMKEGTRACTCSRPIMRITRTRSAPPPGRTQTLRTHTHSGTTSCHSSRSTPSVSATLRGRRRARRGPRRKRSTCPTCTRKIRRS